MFISPLSPFNIISPSYPSPYQINAASYSEAVKNYLKIKKDLEIKQLFIYNENLKRQAYIKYFKSSNNRTRANILFGNPLIDGFPAYLSNVQNVSAPSSMSVEYKTVLGPKGLGILPVIKQRMSIEDGLKILRDRLVKNLKPIEHKNIITKLHGYTNKADKLDNSDYSKFTVLGAKDFIDSTNEKDLDNFVLLLEEFHHTKDEEKVGKVLDEIKP